MAETAVAVEPIRGDGVAATDGGETSRTGALGSGVKGLLVLAMKRSPAASRATPRGTSSDGPTVLMVPFVRTS